MILFVVIKELPKFNALIWTDIFPNNLTAKNKQF